MKNLLLSYVLIPEKENVLVLPEFLKSKYFVKGKSPKNIEFLRKSTLFKENLLKMSEFLYWSMKTFFLSRKSLNFYLVRQNAI
jgi:hypothetical protein